ncbi:hypothetical protein [Euzebya tangerina]|uniref:hypothetical protein n=1 Tax=Euzebya tangerina TaxID=591198 RepID=UPI000E3175A4|nr:hypothetical protein [Euzebya tangerina]
MVEHATPRHYEIVIRGHVSHRLLRPLLDDFVVTHADGRTRLTGNIVDPSQLHGVLQHLTSFALELDHVNRVDDDATAQTDPNSKDTP